MSTRTQTNLMQFLLARVTVAAMAMTTRNPACPYLFQYRGRQLKNFRTGFEAAREAAKLPALIFQDTRRTAVRNMVLAGISEKRAMQISGHRTPVGV